MKIALTTVYGTNENISKEAFLLRLRGVFDQVTAQTGLSLRVIESTYQNLEDLSNSSLNLENNSNPP